MAIRNDGLGGTDWTEEGLKPSDLNETFDAVINKLPKFYFDSTGSSVSNSTSETDLLSVTISQNDLGSSATLQIWGRVSFQNTNANATNPTFRVYVDGVQKDSFSYSDGSNIDNMTKFYAPVVWFETGVDTSAGDVEVKVTGQLSAAESDTAAGDILLVTGYKSTI